MHRTYRGKEKDEDLESVIELYDLEKDPREARNIALQNQWVILRFIQKHVDIFVCRSIVQSLKEFALKEYVHIIPPKFGIRAMVMNIIFKFSLTKNIFRKVKWRSQIGVRQLLKKAAGKLDEKTMRSSQVTMALMVILSSITGHSVLSNVEHS